MVQLELNIQSLVIVSTGLYSYRILKREVQKLPGYVYFSLIFPFCYMQGISFQFTVILLELTVGGITITGGTLGAMKENNNTA